MPKLSKIVLMSFALGMATTAQADIAVTFTESAPKDRFTLTNMGGCDLGPSTFRINIGSSPAALIFDTTASGSGVEVFQPFEIVTGAEYLNEIPLVSDGDQIISLKTLGLPAGQTLAFSIDIDDQLTDGALGQIRVAGSEIAGTEVSLVAAGFQGISRLGPDARTTLVVPTCIS